MTNTLVSVVIQVMKVPRVRAEQMLRHWGLLIKAAWEIKCVPEPQISQPAIMDLFTRTTAALNAMQSSMIGLEGTVRRSLNNITDRLTRVEGVIHSLHGKMVETPSSGQRKRRMVTEPHVDASPPGCVGDDMGAAADMVVDTNLR